MNFDGVKKFGNSFSSSFDMADARGVVSLIRPLVFQEVERNVNYHGAIVFGSLAHGDSCRESDIDLMHVVTRDSRVDDVLVVGGIRERFKEVLTDRFGITVDEYFLDIGLLGDRKGEFLFGHACSILDKTSILIIPDSRVASQVIKYGCFYWTHPVYRHRKLKSGWWDKD